MDMNSGRDMRGVLFDKDGTLFDFHRSWSSWMAYVLGGLSCGNAAQAERAGIDLGFDLAERRFDLNSPFVAGTPESTLELLRRSFPDLGQQEILGVLTEATVRTPQVEVVPLRPLMTRLAGSGLALGIATNDHESTARAHLEQADVLDHFEFVAGSDSGFGAKPDTGMLLAFCELTGIDPGLVAMVGDSAWDLEAGRAAGMTTVAVLTGTATRSMLSPTADVILNHIGELPGWLGLETTAGPRTGVQAATELPPA